MTSYSQILITRVLSLPSRQSEPIGIQFAIKCDCGASGSTARLSQEFSQQSPRNAWKPFRIKASCKHAWLAKRKIGLCGLPWLKSHFSAAMNLAEIAIAELGRHTGRLNSI